MSKIVALFSGGMDSATLLFKLRDQGYEVEALGIDYGQRHSKELRIAQEFAKQTGFNYKVVNAQSLAAILSGSSQTSDLDVPEGHYEDESMKLTVVPNRN